MTERIHSKDSKAAIYGALSHAIGCAKCTHSVSDKVDLVFEKVFGPDSECLDDVEAVVRQTRDAQRKQVLPRRSK